MEANPFNALNLRQAAEQTFQIAALIQIHSVICQVLGNEHELFYTLRSQIFSFLRNHFNRFGNLFSTNEWDGAVRTLAVATLRYF